MSEGFDLQRFVDAQQGVIEAALMELRSGRKQNHWMWFVFPQLAGLGRSAIARHYGIGSYQEAASYLAHPLLGSRLRDCVDTVLAWAGRRTAEEIFGQVDAMKLKSCLTLFECVEPNGSFAMALERFYGGERDGQTLALLGEPL